MNKVHPVTYIVAGLLGAACAVIQIQCRQIEQLKKERYPVIIRRGIEYYEKAPKDRVI